MLQWLNSLIGDIQVLVSNAVVLVAMWTVATVWYRTRALVPVLGACLLAGIALFAVHNTDWFQDKVAETVERPGLVETNQSMGPRGLPALEELGGARGGVGGGR